MPAALVPPAIVVPLLVATWALIAAARDRAPDRIQYAGTLLVTAVVLVLLAGSAVEWLGGDGPEQTVVFLGYALTAAVLPYGSWVVGRLEPTRFGSLIIGVAALVEPVLVVRLGQVWGA